MGATFMATNCACSYCLEEDVNLYQGNIIFKPIVTNLISENDNLSEEEKRILENCENSLKLAEEKRVIMADKFKDMLDKTGAGVLFNPTLERAIISFVIYLFEQIIIYSNGKIEAFEKEDFKLTNFIKIDIKKIYQDKLKEIEHLTNEIKIKDDEIILMNNAKNKIYNIGSSNPNEENKNINIGKKDISEEELKAELLKLGQEYNDEVQKCTKIHEEKIKNMKEEINQLKKQINVYYNKNEYILKEDHDKFLEELKKRHEKELEPFKKELNDLEKYIAENFPEMIKANS